MVTQWNVGSKLYYGGFGWTFKKSHEKGAHLFINIGCSLTNPRSQNIIKCKLNAWHLAMLSVVLQYNWLSFIDSCNGPDALKCEGCICKRFIYKIHAMQTMCKSPIWMDVTSESLVQAHNAAQWCSAYLGRWGLNVHVFPVLEWVSSKRSGFLPPWECEWFMSMVNVGVSSVQSQLGLAPVDR